MIPEKNIQHFFFFKMPNFRLTDFLIFHSIHFLVCLKHILLKIEPYLLFEQLFVSKHFYEYFFLILKCVFVNLKFLNCLKISASKPYLIFSNFKAFFTKKEQKKIEKLYYIFFNALTILCNILKNKHIFLFIRALVFVQALFFFASKKKSDKRSIFH